MRAQGLLVPGGYRAQHAVARRSDFGRSIARTAAFNVVGTVAAGGSGVVIARALGPVARGHYAAISVWLVVAFTVGDLGMTAATTYFMAREPGRGRDYLATSRVITAGSGLAVLAVGLAIAPTLGRHDPVLTAGYRLTAVTCFATVLGFCCTAALQATNLPRWNIVRLSQPVLYALAVTALWVTGRLELMTALIVLLATTVAQSVLAYGCCRRQGLLPGRADAGLVRPVARYGGGELATTAPYLAISRLDQIALSFTGSPAGLGHYAVASSLTHLAVPLVSAVGHVAFPRLATAELAPAVLTMLRRRSVALSGALGIALMAALVTVAPWLVPVVFGPGFDDSVRLIWLLAPAGVFLPCSMVGADLLRASGRPLSVAYVQGASALLLAGLLGVLVPRWAELGAAVATSTTAACSCLLMLGTLLRTPGPAQRSER